MNHLLNETDLSVVYSVDATESRRKTCGLSLLDQLLLSLSSLRSKWSRSVPVYIMHTTSIPEMFRETLLSYDVELIHMKEPFQDGFPLANKISVGKYYTDSKDLLFLDCDTCFHRPISFDSPSEITVAFDALQSLSANEYAVFFGSLGVPLPKQRILERPAFEYYVRGTLDQFPQLNSGVFFLRKDSQSVFFNLWTQFFKTGYSHFRSEAWEFYIEQLAFIAAVLTLPSRFTLFPLGVNFICTPRAPYLSGWPAKEIILEHYAGDTSKPLVFIGDRIDPEASGLF